MKVTQYVKYKWKVFTDSIAIKKKKMKYNI